MLIKLDDTEERGKAKLWNEWMQREESEKHTVPNIPWEEWEKLEYPGENPIAFFSTVCSDLLSEY